ncbi:hypothetical protein OIE43_44310 [Streptomyces pseudovenezuelae]|uniref:hypothetical protein n=1 Tax=Streptomyces pseudovenezuelae TaxID=67350 RepID=UPI002E342B3A|nr:hypothetical protein [Streptomyces pseudovenezuelae]
MPRTAPTQAELKLMDAAAASGFPVSASQLERWRHHGLIPSPCRRTTGAERYERVYPDGTEDLVCALARHAGSGRSYDDLALLAFFSGATVPEVALKAALARVYFKHRVQHEEQVERVQAQVPPQWAAEMDAEYEQAEAAAKISLAENGRAIRQMRTNLRRRPDLARSSREEVDARLLGVLVGLERRQLPESDAAFMTDLSAALHLDCDIAEDCLAVWDYAAVCHVSQMGRQETTSPRKRLERLVRISVEDLQALRSQVLDDMDQVWTRATGGRQTRVARDQPWLARSAAGVLMEWMSAREAHPPGSVLADRYFIDSLADLSLRCWIFQIRSAWVDRPGEGRTAFTARTTG